MASTEISSLSDGGVILDTDLLVVSRSGAGRKVTGARLVRTNTAGDSVIVGDAVLSVGCSLMAATAPLIGGNGGSLTYVYSGTSAVQFRNAADTSTLLTIANSGAISATGTLNVVGAITQNGQQVWHSGNFAGGAAYMPKGGGLFTGTVQFGNDANFRLEMNGGNPLIIGDTGSDLIGYNRSLDFWDFTVAGQSRLQVGMTGANVNGTLTVNGVGVWTGGNFNPANYMLASGGTFGGAVSAPSLSVGSSAVWHAGNLNPADFLTSAVLSSYATTSALTSGLAGKQASLGYTPANAAGQAFTGAVSAPSLTVAGSAVWHAGNLDPATKASLTGATFTGTVVVPTLQLAAGITARASGGKLVFAVGGVDVASIDSAGTMRLKGDVLFNQVSV